MTALEFGSLDINGSIQPLFPNAKWWGIDIVEGPRVDAVEDAAYYAHSSLVNLVVCCEVFEHTPLWPQIIANAYSNIEEGSAAIFTCAGRGRPAHSAVDGGSLRAGEYYQNVDENDIRLVMESAGFLEIVIEWLETPGDVRAFGIK